MTKWLLEYKIDLPRKRKIFKRILEAPKYTESDIREIILEVHPKWKILHLEKMTESEKLNEP